MTSVLSAKHFHNEAAAYAFLEARVWPNGPICPHCGGTDRISKMGGESTRIGAYKCYQCRGKFTVKVGTVLESSHVPLNKWLQAISLMASSKKGISSNQLHRILGVTLKTAWFMSHRIREAMRDGKLGPLGGEGMIVEADETYMGHKDDRRPMREHVTKFGRSGPAGKRAVLSLVERGGRVRSFHIERADKATIGKIVSENIARESYLYTDESRLYGDADHLFAERAKVKHSAGEYVRYEGERVIHTNTVEGVFSVLKRGMTGVYQHCAEKHLHRYLAEFDFRYNARAALGVNDLARTDRAIQGIVGKRLKYQTAN